MDLSSGGYADNYSKYIWDEFSDAGDFTLFAEERIAAMCILFRKRSPAVLRRATDLGGRSSTAVPDA